MEEEDDFGLIKLFEQPKELERKANNHSPLNSMLTEPFTWYFLPQNILTETPNKERPHLNLGKFKEFNTGIIMEDMMYYCAPVDILAKIDAQNSEYCINESQSEFVEDLGIVTFLQNQKLIIKNMQGEYKVDKFINDQNLKEWKRELNDEDKIFDEKIIDKTNIILKLIQNTLKHFTQKKIEKDQILENLNLVISDIKSNEINLKSIGYKILMVLENNLLFLFGLIIKSFGKELECVKLFLEKYIKLFSILKSNRIFFALIEYLNKNRKVLEGMKIENPLELFTNKCIDISELIKSIENNKDFENKLILPTLLVDEKNCCDKNEIWALNNSEEIFIFKISQTKPKMKLIFYRINIRLEENSILDDDYYEDDICENKDGKYKLIDFGELVLSNSEDDQIFDINISIKNDLIYVCYFINKKLNNSGTESDTFEYGLYYKVYTTSMILLKEDLIKSDNFKCDKTFLYSDKDNLYVISENNRIFVMKKEYSMKSFESKELVINSENNDILITDYKCHNNFNIENLLILENKKDINDLLLVQIYSENNKCIYKLLPIQQNLPNNEFKYKISYNDNIFLFIKMDENNLYFSFNDMFEDNFTETGFQFRPFEINLKKDLYISDNNSDFYKKLIKEYAYFVKLYGNFDRLELEKMGLTDYPYSFCFNINKNNMNFIIEEILNEKDMEINYYYIIILKQFMCCLYNTNEFDIKMFTRILEYFKNFIMNIKTNKDNKYRYKILKEIIYLSSYFDDVNIIEISDVENLLKIKEDEKDFKINLLLIDLLFTQPKTQQNPKLYELVCEFEKNVLTEIFKEKIESKLENKIISSYFKLYKKVMLKAMVVMNNYYLKKESELFSNIKKISDNVVYISKLYKNICDTNLGKMPFLFNSINFMFFFLIIQKRIYNEKFNKDLEIFTSLYNALITLDNLNINQYKKSALDLNNLIELTNSKIESQTQNNKDLKNLFNDINFKSKQNITFRSNFINYVGSINLNSYFEKIVLIKKNKDSSISKKEIDLNHCINEIFYDVYGLEVYFKENIDFKWRAILDIIPIKDSKKFLEIKHNENCIVINLIQKTLLYYFLYLFENAKKQINDFLKKDKVKKFCKIYHNEFLQFINTNDIEIERNILEAKKDLKEKKEDEDENILDEIDVYIEKLKNSLTVYDDEKDKEKDKNITNVNLIMELLNKFISFFGDFNRGENKNVINFEGYYNKKDITLNQIKSYKEINLEDKSFEKIFGQFEKDIDKKNKLLSSLRANESIKKMILKIFQIIIKYYNFNTKFLDLVKKENFTSQNEDYTLFLDIYEKCCQMKMVYNQEKSRFIDEKFEEQAENYFKVTNAKLDFLYKIIIPSFNENLKYDKNIVQNLIELIKNERFDPKELLYYSEIQNINCNFKVIEFLIINNLLLNLNDEENIKLILHIVNDIYNKNKENNKYSISESLLDSIYGADYSQMQQVKNQFHLLIGIILEKYIYNKNVYDNLEIVTKILLHQSLLWKYKGRDFNIMPKILNCFVDLKKGEFNKENILFNLKHDKIHRINNYNMESLTDIKFEIFKIITSQIFAKLKEGQTNNKLLNPVNSQLSLTRNLSLINNSESILSLLMSYFIEIQKNNKYYFDMILFFYKNIINSKKLIDIINTTSFYEVMVKILKIIFDDETTPDNKAYIKHRNNYTKFIILKLFLQVLENIDNQEKRQNLIDCCLEYDKNAFKENEEDFNPFIYLITKFNNLINKEECSFLKQYYLKIFLFCLNKVDKSEPIIEKNKLLDLNFLLSLRENLNQLESRFYIKNKFGNEFEEIALFSNNEKIKNEKLGTLLCFMEDNKIFNNFVVDASVSCFDYNEFKFNIEQKQNNENMIVIMDDTLKEKIIQKMNNLDIKEMKDVILIPGQNSNLFYDKYIQKNASYIYDKLIHQLNENKLNYKGINYILKMILNILDYINIESADKLIKYIFNYIEDKDVEKNQKEWDFCSYEYFDNEMNSFKNIFYSFSFDINKEIKAEKELNDDNDENISIQEAPLLLSTLFNYSIINNNEFYIEYKSNKSINKHFPNELELKNNNTNKENEKEINTIDMSNLSFYKSSTINNTTIIKENSLLLTEISSLSDVQELLKIVVENSGKIKAIIISYLKNPAKEESNRFLNEMTVPVYLVSNNFYNQLKKFFIEGTGGIHLDSSKKSKNEGPEIIPIYYPIFYLKYKSFRKSKENNNNKKEEDVNNYYLNEDLGLDILFGENQEKREEDAQLDEKQRNDNLLQYKKNIIKKRQEINFDINKVFCVENIKICYRILYNLLQKENIINQIKIEILNKNMDIIMNIFDLLYKEYYFNIKQQLPIYDLQNLLKNFVKSLGKLNNFGKKWSQCLINHIYSSIENSNKKEKENEEIKNPKSDSKIIKKDINLSEFSDISDFEEENDDKKKEKHINKSPKKKEEDHLIEENCKKTDLLLFIFKNNNDLILDENSINFSFEIINYILQDSIGEEKINNQNSKDKTKMISKEFITLFLFEFMDSIYNIIRSNKTNSKLLKECFINNNKFHELMLKFINEEIDIENYFIKEGKINGPNIPKSKTLLVQFGFKYLDICLYIFLKEKKYNIINYWLKSKNNFFYFYSSYKMLSTDLHYEEIDYKEILSIIAYISDSISCFNKRDSGKNKYIVDKNNVQMKLNEFNKVKLNYKSDFKSYINLTSFSFDGLDNSEENNIKFNKLAVFTYNKNEDKYNLIDVIDTSDFSSIKTYKNYLQIFNIEDIYLVPLEKLSTSLYAFGSNFNHSLGINGKLAKYYDKPKKCEGLPNNIWNIGYGNNYCLALSEDEKKIYACGCNRGGGFNSTPRALFTEDTKINKNKNSDEINKFINFATGNCDSTLLLNENGELFGIGNNEEEIFGFKDEPKIKYPKQLNTKIWTEKDDEEEEEKKEETDINKIKEESKIGKIKSFYIGYKNSYIINEEGKLFGIGNNEYYQISSNENKMTYTTWKNIPLPDNCKKFAEASVGEDFILCLIEDNNGNNKLYARGRNDYNQCGIAGKEKNIKCLTMCDNAKNLNFKKIYTRNKESAAITIDGDLYMINMFGGQQLTLVSFDEKNLLKNKNNSQSLENTNKNEIKEMNEIKDEYSDNEFKRIIVDDVALSMSHMLIIARQYDREKGIYIKKLFGLGNNSKGALGLPIQTNKDENLIGTITEIALFDDNNKKLIPVQLTIGDNKSYVLCVNEEELIQSIKTNKKKDNPICSINISNISIEKEEKKILDFYYSKNVELFINIFRLITSKAISNFIEAIDEIKMEKQDIIEKENIFTVSFEGFFNYLVKHERLKELYHIFIQSNISEKDINLNLGTKPELESIFNYIQSKSKFIITDLFKYCSTNEKSEYKQFLQKAIGNNLLYLNAQLRIDKFNELFSKLNRKRGTERRIEVDRFKANTFYDKFNENPKNRIPDLDLNQTIFGQVFKNFGNTKGEDFLLQKDRRLFIVALINEYASDSGGPYHEVISGMCQELQSDYLDLFIKTPNNKHDIGLLRDKYIPNPDAKRKICEEGYEFLGKIMASAIASGEALDLNLHPVVWQGLLGNEITFYDYENIDFTFFSLINNLEKELIIDNDDKEKKEEKGEGTEENISTKDDKSNQLIKKEDYENFQEKYNLNFVIKNSNESDIELKSEGEKTLVTLDNLKEYITLSKKMRTSEFATQIEFLKKGFNSVIPSSIFQHLYWRQLEELVCGKATLDIRTFKENTRYEGFQKTDNVIKWFWDWLENCTEHEQSLYLKFVSGRTRLPKDKNFKYIHTIAKNTYNGSESFPNSATCFFTLKLPVYKDRETLEKKMNYAILNCDEIDGDN